MGLIESRKIDSCSVENISTDSYNEGLFNRRYAISTELYDTFIDITLYRWCATRIEFEAMLDVTISVSRDFLWVP